MTFRPETVVAIDAVERALELTRLRVGATELTRKDDGDLVTATDVAVEDAVRNLIGETLGLPVVGEERGGEAPPDRASYWLVDPICGTRNFAAGIPLFCVNVALVEGSEITVAVVGDASTDAILVAERGRGALALKGGASRRLTSSDASRTIVIEDSHAEGDRRDLAANFVAGVVRDNRWEIRSLSSTLALRTSRPGASPRTCSSGRRPFTRVRGVWSPPKQARP
jgi:myo-inositol-1(or 4)-monophosphatase